MNMERHQYQFFNDLKTLCKQAKKARSKCLCPNCSANAIYSHVFSHKHILQPICPASKIYLFEARDLIFISQENMLHYKLRGLNKAFGFHGFCNKHDNEIFADIEPSIGYVDWHSIRNQYLLSYRSLCREIYINRTIHDILKHLLFYSTSNVPNHASCIRHMLARFNAIFANLSEYKIFLEKGVFHQDYSDVSFHCIELPFQLDLCISAPFPVDDGRGPCFNHDFQELYFVNVFPYYGKTIIIIGYSEVFRNEWMKNIIPLFSSPYPHIVSKAFTELMYRVEFNAIGPNLFSKLDKELIECYYRTFREEADNYGMNIDTIISSLLYDPLNEIMPDTWKTL